MPRLAGKRAERCASGGDIYPIVKERVFGVVRDHRRPVDIWALRSEMGLMIPLIQAALGGAIGASLRYLTGKLALRVMGSGFPWGTLTVNILGSFFMGVLVVLLAERFGNRFAPLLMTGLLGGFTTFSAFSLDAVTLMERGQVGTALGYVLVSVIVSILALMAGLVIMRGAFL